MSTIKKITGHRLFMPIVCLLIVLLVNIFKTPSFFKISIVEGHLSGWLIDVINRASELVILAIGMTLVTAASGGQDISVGAVMAVAASVCCQLLSGGQVSTTSLAMPIIIAAVAGIIVAGVCGAFNGFLVAKLNIQPMVATLILYTAGPWYRPVDYKRPDHLCTSRFLQSYGWLSGTDPDTCTVCSRSGCCSMAGIE